MGAGPDVEDHHIGIQIAEVFHQPLLAGIGHIGRGQGLTGTGNQAEIRMKRDGDRDVVQSIDSFVEKIRQGTGPAHIKIGQQNLAARLCRMPLK